MLGWIRGKLGFARARSAASLRRQAEDALSRGALEEAQRSCRALLERSPRDAVALALMATIAADRRQVEDGMRWAELARAAAPESAAPCYALGRLLDLAGRPGEAEASYRRAIALQPDHARAHNNLGCILSLQGRLGEAVECFRRAIELEPALPEANQNYAALTNNPAAQEAAIRGYVQQTARDPRDAHAFARLGNVYAGLGRVQEAMAALERAIELDAEHAEAQYSRAVLLLQSGRYAEGWRAYAWRWRLNGPQSAPAHRFAMPFWEGTPLPDGTLLLHGEAAFGESLQFVRYAALAAARCRRVVFECAPQLKPLLARAAGISELVSPGEAPPAVDAHLPLFELPRVFGTTLESVPWRGPYLGADPAKRSRWQAAIDAPSGGRLKVGLAWTGNARNPNNLDRSVPVARLAPLQEIPGVTLYGLQMDLAAEGTRPALPRLIDLTPGIADFSDTAAIVAQLDLVICIDSALAHLAGAMAVPVWVMLNRVPDWRYHLDRADNPWYPTMRLYRQDREGDWAGVVRAVAADLSRLAEARPSAAVIATRR